MPHLIRHVLLCGIFCALAFGCAAPRTFVSEADEQDAEHAKTSAKGPTTSKTLAQSPTVPKSAPNHPEPSVWSKWVGAFTPAKPKPTQRIPLPRTDKTSPVDNGGLGRPDVGEFRGF